jgi:predicted nucleic acid-binding protein
LLKRSPQLDHEYTMFKKPDDLGLTEEAALAYGDIMGAASRQGLGMSAPDGMIAAIARVNGGRLATRNPVDFRTTGLELISPWDF